MDFADPRFKGLEYCHLPASNQFHTRQHHCVNPMICQGQGKKKRHFRHFQNDALEIRKILSKQELPGQIITTEEIYHVSTQDRFSSYFIMPKCGKQELYFLKNTAVWPAYSQFHQETSKNKHVNKCTPKRYGKGEKDMLTRHNLDEGSEVEPRKVKLLSQLWAFLRWIRVFFPSILPLVLMKKFIHILNSQLLRTKYLIKN